MKAWQIFLLSLVTGFLATLAVASAFDSPDGITFCKIFRGDIESIEGNITIKDAGTGKIYYNGPLPADHKICIQVPHDTTVLIQWKDWRGQMSERHTVLCTPITGYVQDGLGSECMPGYDELVNCIPFPKSGEQTGSG